MMPAGREIASAKAIAKPPKMAGRQTVGDDFFHSPVEILIRRSKISAQHSRHVAEILLKERFIEVKLGFDIGHDFGWESAFAIERAARSQAQKNKRQGRHDPEDNDAMKKPFQKEGGHRVLENNARNTREKRDLAF